MLLHSSRVRGIVKLFDAVLISLLQNERFMIFFSPGLAGVLDWKSRWAAPTAWKQCAQPEPFPADPLHSEGVGEPGLTHIVRGIAREWMEADLISAERNCSTASFALALYRLAIRKLILPLPWPIFFLPAQGNRRAVLQLIIALGTERTLPHPTLQCFLIELGLLWALTGQLMDCGPNQQIIFEGTEVCNRTPHAVIGDKPRNKEGRKQEIRNPWGRCIRFILLSFYPGDKVFVFFKTQWTHEGANIKGQSTPRCPHTLFTLCRSYC